MADGAAYGACLRSWQKAYAERDGCHRQRAVLGNIETD
jgi:hypothetical protein